MKNGIARFWAIFMTLVLVAGIVAGVVFWQKGNIEFHPIGQEQPNDEEKEEASSGAVIGNLEGEGIAISCSLISPENYAANGISEQTDTAYELTASVYPSTATDLFAWSVAFKNPSSAWASGKKVSSYVTVEPSGDDSLIATMVCKQPFG